jgi:Macrocin-O-methyltransferase (TylF)
MINKHFILTNPLTRRLYGRFLHFLDGQNIERKLQDIALEETARFVMENMPGVPAMQNDFEVLRHAWQHVDTKREGLVCEFGVYRGTTINFLSSLTPKTVHGFDSFEGLPEYWRHRFEKGRFQVNRLPKVRSNVRLIKGWFNETLPRFLAENRGDAIFLHVDSDLYSSARTIFTLFRDRIKPGTVIVFDEYFNYPGWKDGEHKAFNEFLAETGLKYEWLVYCCYHEQVAVRIK